MLVPTRAVIASTTPSFAPIIACAVMLRLSVSSCASDSRVNAGAAVVPIAFVYLPEASLAFLSTASGQTALLDFGP